ncbi:MAG: hypothetical protein NTV80_07615 [Verrucomicrobia bacterium]|nr:hypothetical protein [Verrucomicrobiota bacterium]
MNDETQLCEGLTRYVAGDCDPKEVQELSARLESDPAACDLLAEILMQGVALRELAQAHPKWVQATSRIAQRRLGWLSWRPLTAAAAGLVLGCFGASVAWALVTPKTTPVSISLPLIDESFENPDLTWPAGFPNHAGKWRGQPGRVVLEKVDAAPEAKDAAYMLQLDPTSVGFHRSYLFRIIDLKDLPLPAAGETRQIELTGSFHAASPGEDERYTLRMASFTQTPEEIRDLWATWDEMDDRTLTLVKNAQTIPASVTGWQTLSASVAVPRNARCVVISLGAGRDESKNKRTPHYIDDVHVRLLISPHTPFPGTEQP